MQQITNKARNKEAFDKVINLYRTWHFAQLLNRKLFVCGCWVYILYFLTIQEHACMYVKADNILQHTYKRRILAFSVQPLLNQTTTQIC